jgi:hypothetical protein
VSRWRGLLALALTVGCSDLDEGEAGVVALQIQVPESTSLEVGEQVQLSAVALDADGEVVEAPVTWRSPASPRSCTTASCTIASPVGPAGWPRAISPPSVLNGMRPPGPVSPASSSFSASPSAQKPSSS